MPRSTMDGLAFLRALRDFDRDLAIIIRTASESDQIADRAIELRAFKRAVKSKTTLAELRSSTQDAIRETRERRETTRNARDTEATKSKLVEALGSYDLRLAAADVHRGLVHSLRDRLTALSALASVLRKDAAASKSRAFADHASRAAELVGGMVDSVNAFLDGPFGDGSEASRAAVNVCLAALRQFFEGAERWSAEGKRLVVRDLMSDALAEVAPLDLVNGLRHLVEFFFLRVPASAEVSLAATIVHSAAQMGGRLQQADCVLNREAIRLEHPYAVLRISGAMPSVSVDEIRDAFGFGVQSGRTGNLNVLSLVLAAVHGAALVSRPSAGHLSIEAIFPLAI
jgi:CheY-like chemotaxis protein